MSYLQKRLKEVRLSKSLTQAQLARESYLSKNTISNVERGITKKLKSDELKLLSNALLVTEDYLLGESEDTNRDKDGLIQPISMLPTWYWEAEIREVLKKHHGNRVIETLLRDIVYFLGQVDTKNNKYYESSEIRILIKFIEYMNNGCFKDVKLLEGFLDLLMSN